jgi:hypothetical protein
MCVSACSEICINSGLWDCVPYIILYGISVVFGYRGGHNANPNAVHILIGKNA